MTAAEEVRNFMNELDAIFESEYDPEDETLDDAEYSEEDGDDFCLEDDECPVSSGGTKPASEMAPKKKQGDVQDYSNPKGQSFAEKNGFVG